MRNIFLAALISIAAAGTVLAQTAPAPTKAPAATTKAPAATTKARTPESLECSRQADAKGLHGTARKKFRAQCKRDLLKKKG
jgi:hypothetical protein